MRTVYRAARSATPIPIGERKYHIAKVDAAESACGYVPSLGWFVELQHEPVSVCAACRRIAATRQPGPVGMETR